MTDRMPVRNQRTAPTFDPSQPRSLMRYFKDLEEWFSIMKVDDETKRKEYAVSYVPVAEEDIWSSLSSFADPTKSYDDFKKAVQEMYPTSNSDRKFTVNDLDLLITRVAREGINTIEDLSNYYRQYHAMSTFLIEKDRISKGEQSRGFKRGIPDTLWARIAARLQIVHPQHNPEDAYPLTDIYSAATFVLHGTVPASPFAAPVAQPAASPVAPAIKTEELSAMFETFAKTITMAMAPILTAVQTQQQQSSARAALPMMGRPPRGPGCLFCNEMGHMISMCPKVEEDMRNGRCRRSSDGRVVLPSGAFIPGSLPGETMRDRLNEWHRLNPGQTANINTATMMLGVASPSNATFSLTADDRIAALEKELILLRSINAQSSSRREVFDGVQVPRNTHSRTVAGNPNRTGPPGVRIADPPVTAVIPPIPASTSAPTPTPQSRTEPSPARETPVASTSIPVTPHHPFASARDANRLPHFSRDPTDDPRRLDKSKEPAYRNTAPIQDPKIAESVYTRTMKNQNITLSTEELYSISPEIRTKVREAITVKRNVPFPTAVMASIEEVEDEEAPVVHSQSQDDATPIDDDLPFSPAHFDADDPYEAFEKADSFVLEDPRETYIRSLAPGEEPEPMIVAKESHALRSIYALIDNREQIECVVDPGSQVISMSEDVCHALGLSYDPSLQITLQSANSTVDHSLGLCRNVPFSVGDITVYLQVHVIRDTAYDILLGRPFDVLTASVVKNYNNEDQTITIRCPNTNRMSTVPTLPRGLPRFRRRIGTKPIRILSRNH